jgi:hypothetical protein
MNRSAFIKSFIISSFGLLTVKGLTKPAFTIPEEEKTTTLLKCYIAGYAYYHGEQVIDQLKPDLKLELKREPDNPYDRRAIAVYFKNSKLGFIPRVNNKIIANIMDQKTNVLAKILKINPENDVWDKVKLEVLMAGNNK